MRINPNLRKSGCAILALLLILTALGFPSAGAQKAAVEGQGESYIIDGLFSFTPREFLSRLQKYLEINYPNCSITSGEDGNKYIVSWEEDTDIYSYIIFFRKDKSIIPCDEPDSADVWCVILSNVSYVLPLGYLTPRNTLEAFLYTVDPKMDVDLSQNLSMMKLTSCLNATLEDPPRYWGYACENDILYEFGFETMDKYMRQAESTQDVAISFESVGVYASNWLAEKQQSEDESDESYVRDGMFTFTPRDFLQRFHSYLLEDYPDCGFIPMDDTGDYVVYLGDNIPIVVRLAFGREDESLIGYDEIDSNEVSRINMSCAGPFTQLEMLTPKDVLSDFLYTLDPKMNSVSESIILNAKWDAFIDITEENNNEAVGHAYENGILYEFPHFFVDAYTDDGSPILAEYNIVYASLAED